MGDIEIRQCIDWKTHTFTYFVWHKASKEAVIIDPVLEHHERDKALANQLCLDVKLVLDTHIHADHKTGAFGLKKIFKSKHVLGENTHAPCADMLSRDRDMLPLEHIRLETRLTPGHTKGCTSFVLTDGKDTAVFTGDALLIRGCGRTDFQGGDASTLFQSVHKKLYTLNNHTTVYPGHDYNGQTQSTVAEEKAFNPRLHSNILEDQFIDIMSELSLQPPKNIESQLSFNMGN